MALRPVIRPDTMRSIARPRRLEGEASSSEGRAEAAYLAVRHAILNNVFPPGYKAAEADIARQLAMSRTPVHEAMARLQEEGLVRILARRGIVVCALTPEDIEEIYEIAMALEGAAARRLARASEEERGEVLAVLESATSSMETALREGDLLAWAEADERFHQGLVNGCGNGRLIRMVATVMSQLYRSRLLTVKLRSKRSDSAVAHRTIIEAIRAGDAENARLLASRHRQRARDEVVPLVARLNLVNL